MFGIAQRLCMYCHEGFKHQQFLDRDHGGFKFKQCVSVNIAFFNDRLSPVKYGQVPALAIIEVFPALNSENGYVLLV